MTTVDFTAKMTNIGSEECIPLVRDIMVCYNNGSTSSATLTVTCPGATVSPASISVGPGVSKCSTFTVTHAAAGAGHTITATMVQDTYPPGSIPLSSADEVGVKIGNPCPIVTDPIEGIVGGIAQLARNVDLTGKYNHAIGNRVMLLLEEPMKLENGKIKRSNLIFADPAQVHVDKEQGLWKHAAIPNAEKGHHLRIVLTKDGVVKSIIRAVYSK